MYKIKQSVKIVLGILFFIFPISTYAAGLYMSPNTGTFGPGDEFYVDVLVNVDSDCVNTIDAYLSFPKDYLNIKDFLVGESIINLWLEKPNSLNLDRVNRAGVLNFSGGIPGGYCGRIPGDPGRSNLLARIVFEVPSFILSDEDRDLLKLEFLDKTRILLNDGFGTADDVLAESAEFKFSQRQAGSNLDWEKDINNDNIPPEPFVVELHRRPGLFDNQYYIIFSTQDKQSGLDHFEVLEIRPEEEIGRSVERNFWEKWFEEERPAPVWKVAEIPYLLEDQTLKSKIKVMAVDKAGNERVVEYIPPQIVEEEERGLGLRLEIVLLLILAASVATAILVIVLLYKKITAKRKYEEDNK